MNQEELETLPRRQLQTLAKKYGIKANGKSSSIIESLLNIPIDTNKNTTSEENVETQTESNLKQTDDATTNKTKAPQKQSRKENDEKPNITKKEMISPKKPIAPKTPEKENLNEPSQKATTTSTCNAENKKEPKQESCKKLGSQRKPVASVKVTPTASMKRNGTTIKKTKPKLPPINENTTAPTTVSKTQRKKRIDFNKVHEQMFSNQKSIADKYNKSASAKKKKVNSTAKKQLVDCLETPNPQNKRFRVHTDGNRSIHSLTKSAKARMIGGESIKKRVLTASNKKNTPASVAPKRKKFDLEASLKRPITWKMKTGPVDKKEKKVIA